MSALPLRRDITDKAIYIWFQWAWLYPRVQRRFSPRSSLGYITHLHIATSRLVLHFVHGTYFRLGCIFEVHFLSLNLQENFLCLNYSSALHISIINFISDIINPGYFLYSQNQISGLHNRYEPCPTSSINYCLKKNRTKQTWRCYIVYKDEVVEPDFLQHPRTLLTYTHTYMRLKSPKLIWTSFWSALHK